MWRVALALLVGLSAFAQMPTCDSTVLPVRVMGIGARPSAAVAKQLHISIDGHELASSKIEYGLTPRNTYILLDASGSMRMAPLWDMAQDATRLLAALTPDGNVQIAAFDRSISGFLGRDDLAQNGTMAFQQFFERDEKQGSTSLFEALEAALGAPRAPTHDDAIIIVTDGGENTSQIRSNKLLREVLSANVRVFAVIVAAEPEETPESTPDVLSERIALLEIVRKSGGEVLWLAPSKSNPHNRFVDPSGMTSAQHAVFSWYTAIRSAFYVQLPPLARTAKIKVELSPKIKGARVLYPREIPGCSPRP
jgi:hypothetical protein